MTEIGNGSVAEVIAAAKAENRAALIGYLPAGYPDVETSCAAMAALVEGGCDVVEVGVPYSDPVMDGPVIQAAAESALRSGTTLRDAFTAVSRVASAGGAALVMSYWNPVQKFGVERFAQSLADAGGSGLITPDLIPEEAGEWFTASDDHQLDRVFLVAPSSGDERIAFTANHCRGFVYAASAMGVTGTRSAIGTAAESLVTRVRRLAPHIGVCVGLGVSDGHQAAEVALYADGVIVGSAFVRQLLDQPGPAGVAGVRALAAELAVGVRSR